MTVRRFAERRKWPLERAEARLVAHSADHTWSAVDVVLTLDGPLDAEQRERLLALAEKCTISKALKSGVPVALRASPAREPGGVAGD
jgi:putative redox protein